MIIDGLAIEEHEPLHVKFKKRAATDLIVIHCAATPNEPKFNWSSIDAMHRQRGFIAIGYHYVITTKGIIQEGRPDDVIGAHAQGFNSKSIGICLIGGVDKNGKSVNNFTKEQFTSLKNLLEYLLQEYPSVTKIVGHRDLPKVHKDCPCFDVIPMYGYLVGETNK